jgi:hypothetical protein
MRGISGYGKLPARMRRSIVSRDVRSSAARSSIKRTSSGAGVTLTGRAVVFAHCAPPSEPFSRSRILRRRTFISATSSHHSFCTGSQGASWPSCTFSLDGIWPRSQPGAEYSGRIRARGKGDCAVSSRRKACIGSLKKPGWGAVSLSFRGRSSCHAFTSTRQPRASTESVT